MNIRTKLRREEGAAAVEFALIVGVLVLLIFGMLQFGLAFFQLQNLRASVREGARIGAVGATPDEIRQRVADTSLGALTADPNVIEINPSDACPTDADQQTLNDTVTVSIETTNPNLPAGLQNIFTVNVPFLAPIPLDVEISSEFRCEPVRTTS